MSSYLQNIGTRRTSQSEPIPGSGQVQNDAGGYAWATTAMDRLRRFLILGSEGGSYYAGERKLTMENAQAVFHCVEHHGTETVDLIVQISDEGRAVKNDPAIFALAVASSLGNDETRRHALHSLPKVCRTGTHLFHFLTYAQQFRGWGRGLREAVQRWYQEKPLDAAAYQMTKYRQRDGWSHRDVLRLSHPKPAGEDENELFRWAVGKLREPGIRRELPEAVTAYNRAQLSLTTEEILAALDEFPSLPREALPTQFLADPKVQAAMIDRGMPMTALIRNLGNLTRLGVLGSPLSAGAERTASVINQITSDEQLKKARVHPLTLLAANAIYATGHGVRSLDNSWEPITTLIDALDKSFYAAFQFVRPTNKRLLLALDVSGSMTGPPIAGMPGISPRVGAAAMALVTAAVEPSYQIMAFSQGFVPLNISPEQRLQDVVLATNSLPFEGTDCAVPMLYALQNQLEVDAFVIYTDNETWAGNIHPAQALQEYRRKTGINAKLIVVAMTSGGFSIADPNDPGMLDVVGFDTATPNVLSEFITS